MKEDGIDRAPSGRAAETDDVVWLRRWTWLRPAVSLVRRRRYRGRSDRAGADNWFLTS